MKLVLTNGEKIEIFRQTCGFEYDYPESNNQNYRSRIWNINPIRITENRRKGYFVIGAKWGSNAGDPCEKMIPVDSVLYIENPHSWNSIL